MLTLCLVAALAAPVDPGYFTVPAYSSFDGRTWGGLEISRTTDAELKKLYKTSKGAMRPEGILLTQPDSANYRVDALLKGRGKDARLNGIRINYRGAEPSLEALCQDLPGAPAMFFPKTRYEDWAVAAYPQRGVAFFLDRASDHPVVEWALVSNPDTLLSALQGLGVESSEVVEYVDPYRDLPRLLELGTVSVSFHFDGIQAEDRDQDRDDLERAMKRMKAHDLVHYRSGKRGTFSLAIDASYTVKDGGRVRVTGDLEGFTNYGHVAVHSESARDLKKPRSGENPPRYVRYMSIAEDVISDIEDKIREAIEAQGPPPIQSFRYADWTDLVFRAAPAK